MQLRSTRSFQCCRSGSTLAGKLWSVLLTVTLVSFGMGLYRQPATGTVRIDTRPSGADLRIEGKLLGKSPLRVRYKLGAFVRIEASKDDLNPAAARVKIGPVRSVNLALPIPVERRYVPVYFKCKPATARVHEDSAAAPFLRNADQEPPFQVTPGQRVSYLLKAEGYEDAKVTEIARPGRALEFRVDLPLKKIEVTLETNVPEADVYDAADPTRYLGKAHLLKLLEEPGRTVRLLVKHSGYVDQEVQDTTRPGGYLRLKAALQPIQVQVSLETKPARVEIFDASGFGHLGWSDTWTIRMPIGAELSVVLKVLGYKQMPFKHTVKGPGPAEVVQVVFEPDSPPPSPAPPPVKPVIDTPPPPATLVTQGSPSGSARIRSGGKTLGMLGDTLTLEAGSHTLRIDAGEDYLPETRVVKARSSKTERLLVNLRPSKIELTIRSNPSGAAVARDGQELGETPVKLEVRTKESGSVELALEGYKTERRTLSELQKSSMVTLRPEAQRFRWGDAFPVPGGSLRLQRSSDSVRGELTDRSGQRRSVRGYSAEIQVANGGSFEMEPRCLASISPPSPLPRPFEGASYLLGRGAAQALARGGVFELVVVGPGGRVEHKRMMEGRD